LSRHIELVCILFLVIVIIVTVAKLVGVILHLGGHGSGLGILLVELTLLELSSGFLDLFVFFVNLLVLRSVIAIPAVSLGVKGHFYFLDHLILLDVFAGPLGTLLPWPLDTVPGLVCHGATVLTCTPSVFCCCRALIVCLIN
jgi:hypothetical protein